MWEEVMTITKVPEVNDTLTKFSRTNYPMSADPNISLGSWDLQYRAPS
jgi:hypothetical protein